jgi:hypothetical protein
MENLEINKEDELIELFVGDQNYCLVKILFLVWSGHLAVS